MKSENQTKDLIVQHIKEVCIMYTDMVYDSIVDAISCGDYDYLKNEDGVFEYDTLYDEMFIDDAITGNASGSFTFNRAKAKEYVFDNMHDVVEAFRDGCIDRFAKYMEDEDYETIDVVTRCYYLADALNAYMDDNDELFE